MYKKGNTKITLKNSVSVVESDKTLTVNGTVYAKPSDKGSLTILDGEVFYGKYHLKNKEWVINFKSIINYLF